MQRIRALWPGLAVLLAVTLTYSNHFHNAFDDFHDLIGAHNDNRLLSQWFEAIVAQQASAAAAR